MLENDILETGDKGGDDFEDSDDAKFRVANLFLLRHGKVSRRTKPRYLLSILQEFPLLIMILNS